MYMRLIGISLFFVGVLGSGWISAEQLEGRQKPMSKEEQVLAKKAKLTFAEAKKKALEKAPGQIFNWQLEMEDGKLIYSFEIELPDDKKFSREVNVDAMNGKIVEVEKEDLKTQKENAKSSSTD
jgi:uncharacterized membrane protein YkoI